MPVLGDIIAESKLSEKEIIELAMAQSPIEEIAEAAGISSETLLRRYAKIIKEAQARGKGLLRKSQFKLAAKSAAMSKHLGVNILKQRLVHEEEEAFKDREDLKEMGKELFRVLKDLK